MTNKRSKNTQYTLRNQRSRKKLKRNVRLLLRIKRILMLNTVFEVKWNCRKLFQINHIDFY